MSATHTNAPLDVLSGLVEHASGIDYIYALLERLQRRWDLDDAIVVVLDDEAGRQAFRLGRRPITRGWEATVAADRPPGLYLRPDVDIPEATQRAVVGLTSVALRMDVLRHSSRTDAMTGLYNRSGFDEQLRAARERAQRFDEPFALVILDLDGFKRINDEFGHPAGDRTLISVAHALGRFLRTVDVAARVGGDEFALMLPRTTSGELPIIIDRVRRGIREADAPLPVSASFGSASWPADATDLDELYEIADHRLYEAKREVSSPER